MLPHICLSLLAIATCVTTVAAQDRLQDALLAQETKLIDAINKKDKAAVAELLADEALSITASRGRQTTKEVVAALDKISFTSYNIIDPNAISVSPDVAILTYTFSWTGASAGEQPTTTTVYATSVWKQRDGKWRSVFYQETPIGK